MLGLLPKDGDTMMDTTSNGAHFQTKLALSHSLASVQHLVIPWMLIHLTGAYHRLVDDSSVTLMFIKP